LGNLIAIYATDSINIDARYNYFGTSYHHRLEKLIYSSVGGGVNYSNWLWYRESKVQYVDGTISWTSPIILNEGVIVNGTLTISTEVTFNNVYGQNFILVNGTLNICNANFLSNTGQYSILYLNNTEGNIINSTFVGQKYLGSHRQGFDICDSTFISGGVGVALWRAMNNNITGNNISNNYDGIYLEYSSNNSLKENNASSNNMYGLVLRHSLRNTIDNNIYSSNYYGIALYYSSDYNIIVDNICSDNNPHGIFIYDSSNNNIVTNNTCLSNYWEGIRISYSKIRDRL